MATPKNSVSVIIPTYNGLDLLRVNLPKVIEAKKNEANNINEVVVVDDGSTDGSVSFIKENFPEVKLIKHKIRRGFPSAVNTGVRSSNGELIALLNNDVSPEKNFLLPVLNHFQDPKVFGVSFHERGYGWATGSFNSGYIEIGMGGETDKVHQSFFVSGGSAVFSRKIWSELGGMDEKLFSPFYWEDLDICYRAQKRGYINLWEPNSHVLHLHESTIGKLPKRYVAKIRERNRLLFIWKNIHSAILLRKHVGAVIIRSLRHPGYILAVMAAFFKLSSVLKLRRKEIKESKVSDEAVFSRFSV